MADDYTKDPVWREFERHTLREMLPKLDGSAVCISLMPKDGEGDVKYWCELGASIMLDKPIIVVAPPGWPIPERLRRVADKVLVLDLTHPTAAAELQDALDEIVG